MQGQMVEHTAGHLRSLMGQLIGSVHEGAGRRTSQVQRQAAVVVVVW